MNGIVIKGIIFVSLALAGIFFNRRSPECDDDILMERVERRVERMRTCVDGIYGEGFFARLGSGQMTEEELEALNIRILPFGEVNAKKTEDQSK